MGSNTHILGIRSYYLAPRACGSLLILISIDVDVASAHRTTAEQYIAVWQFLDLSLISVRSSLSYILAQNTPSLTEVIAIENAVTAAGTQHGIDTIILAYLDLLTLTDSTTGKEG